MAEIKLQLKEGLVFCSFLLGIILFVEIYWWVKGSELAVVLFLLALIVAYLSYVLYKILEYLKIR